MRALLVSSLLSSLLLSSPALAAPSRAAVERALGGYEPRDFVAELRRLGEGVDRALCAIAVDERVSPLRRNRALSAIGTFRSLEGRDLLARVIRERAVGEGQDLLDVIAAARALAAFGPDAATEIVPLLSHGNSDVRATAAASLASAHASSALPSIELRLTVERDPEVIRALQAAAAALR